MGDVAEHSLLSASAAPRWTRCYGSVALESTQPNEGSKYAREGTAAHALAAFYLGSGANSIQGWETRLWQPEEPISQFIGETIEVEGDYFTVDDEMADAVQSYVDYCRSLGGVALVETKVNYANWLGVAEELAWGTSDFIAIHDDPEVITIDAQGYLCPGELENVLVGRLIMTAVDFKYGAGVAVYPEDNEQAMLYEGGALNEIEFAIDVRDDDIVRIVIHQPRIGEGEPLEWYIQVGALKRWLRGEAATAAAHAVKLHAKIKDAAGEYLPELQVISEMANHLTPGDKQCKFCNAKAICPALSKLVVDTVTSGFTDLTQVTEADIKAVEYTPLELSQKLALAPLIEAALKSWRAAGEALLIEDPQSVPGWKLVRGKKGARAWGDPAAALKRLVRYLGTAKAVKPREPISPTQAEKLLSAKQYAILDKEFITQAEGGVSMAPVDDPRPALDLRPSPAAFPDLTGDEDDLSHLA